MFLKNYTSQAPVSQTIFRIEQVLLKCGVTNISKDYGINGKIVAITFKIEGPGGKPWPIRMPADEDRACEALWLDYVDGDKLSKDGSKIEDWSSQKKKRRIDFAEQASRTAWKIMQDWVEVQMSMIQMKQADVLEVFLPYAWDGKKTYYQAMKDAKFAGLLPEKTES